MIPLLFAAAVGLAGLIATAGLAVSEIRDRDRILATQDRIVARQDTVMHDQEAKIGLQIQQIATMGGFVKHLVAKNMALREAVEGQEAVQTLFGYEGSGGDDVEPPQTPSQPPETVH